MMPSHQSLQDEVAALMLRVARPLIWHDRNQGWPKPLNGATCFFLRFDRGIVGVTANHVVEEFERAVTGNANVVCQLRNSPAFDLLGAIISRDEAQDIATFAVSEAIVSKIGTIPLDCRAGWPPPEPQPSSLVSACGFPESIRVNRPDSSAEFRAWGTLATVEWVTRDEILITYDPAVVQGVAWAPALPPVGFNMSGCSGGPVLMHIEQGGLHRWYPVALIAEGPRHQHKQGEAAEFDMIRLRRIDAIQPDGQIECPQRQTGWLPG